MMHCGLGFPKTTAQEKEVKPDEVLDAVADTEVNEWPVGISSN